MLCQKQHNRWKLLTFWPINCQISGGREFTILVAAPPAFDADGFKLTASCDLQIPLEILSLSGCPHFDGALGRGPYSPTGSCFSAIAEAEVVVGTFSFGVSTIVAVRFRFRILAGRGRDCRADLKETRASAGI